MRFGNTSYPSLVFFPSYLSLFLLYAGLLIKNKNTKGQKGLDQKQQNDRPLDRRCKRQRQKCSPHKMYRTNRRADTRNKMSKDLYLHTDTHTLSYHRQSNTMDVRCNVKGHQDQWKHCHSVTGKTQDAANGDHVNEKEQVITS